MVLINNFRFVSNTLELVKY